MAMSITNLGVTVKLPLGWAVRLQQIIKRDAETLELRLFNLKQQRRHFMEQVEAKGQEPIDIADEQKLKALTDEIMSVERTQFDNGQLGRFFEVEDHPMFANRKQP